MLSMCDALQRLVLDRNIQITSHLFDSMITQYTESQSWAKVNSLLDQCTIENCDPQTKIVSYLKKNMFYCFDESLRNSLKASLESFEIRFFSSDGR